MLNQRQSFFISIKKKLEYHLMLNKALTRSHFLSLG
jgi:hypothetical protein